MYEIFYILINKITLIIIIFKFFIVFIMKLLNWSIFLLMLVILVYYIKFIINIIKPNLFLLTYILYFLLRTVKIS